MKAIRTVRPRSAAIREVRARFLKRAFPRLIMSLLVAISAGAAFLVSFGLLRAGILSMAVRYGAAALAGYIALLALLRVWLWAAVRRAARGRRESDTTLVDVVLDNLSDIVLPEPGSAHSTFGDGGGFGGGGGGASWGGGSPAAPVHEFSSTGHVRHPTSSSHFFSSAHHGGSGSSSGGDGGFDLDFDFDLDEGWLVAIPIIAAIAMGIVVIGVVWTAPALFADLLLDALVAAGVYRGLRRSDVRSWLGSAVRHTRWAAAAVIVIAVVAGHLIQHFAPDTVSIGDLWR
jgi:hypothetical protein